MNKKTIVPIIILILILLVGAFFLLNSSKKSDSSESTARNIEDANIAPLNQPEDVASDEESITGSLMDLIKLGKSYTCTFTYSDEGSGYDSFGTVFVTGSGKKVSGEFMVTTDPEQKITSNFINDGEYTYIWSSQMPQGIKTKIPEGEDIFSDTQGQNSSSGFDSLENADYKCRPWIVDESKFVVPQNITFTDFSSMLQQSSGQGTPMQDKCSACNFLTEESAKNQCLQALGCN